MEFRYHDEIQDMINVVGIETDTELVLQKQITEQITE
jgi:hypothetical protein